MNYKKAVVDCARLCEQKGLVNGLEGNISLLDRVNNKLYITPSRTRKLTLTEEEVAVLDFETEKQIDGTKKASSEYRLHKAALLARVDCNAVIHCHCTYMTAFAYQCKSIVLDCAAIFRKFKGEIKCLPYGAPGTPEIATGIADAIKDRDICLLGNHGVVCVGDSLDNAEYWLEGVEATVKTAVISKTFGQTSPIPGFDDCKK